MLSQTFPENLANSAFWLSNCILLLYYLRKDPQTQQNTLEYQDNLYDTIGKQALPLPKEILDAMLKTAFYQAASSSIV